MRDYSMTIAQHINRVAFVVICFLAIMFSVTFVVYWLTGHMAIGLQIGIPVAVWLALRYLPWYTISLPANAGAVVSNQWWGFILSFLGENEKTAAQISIGGARHIFLYPWEKVEEFYTLGAAPIEFTVSPNASKQFWDQKNNKFVLKPGQGIHMETNGVILVEPILETLPLFHAAMQADPRAITTTAANAVASYVNDICKELLPEEIIGSVPQINVMLTKILQKLIIPSTKLPFLETFGCRINMVSLADFEAAQKVQDAWNSEAVGETVARLIDRYTGQGMPMDEATRMARLTADLSTLTETKHTQHTSVAPIEGGFEALAQLAGLVGSGGNNERKS